MADANLPTDRLIVLYTSTTTNQLFEVGWRKLETTFDNKNLDYLKVDGVNDPELRKQLWGISGARNYPQVFVPSDGALKFVGGMDEIQEMLDMGMFENTFGAYLKS